MNQRRMPGPGSPVACGLLLFAHLLCGVEGQAQSGPALAPIKTLIRAHEYGKALDDTRSALKAYPKDAQLWTLQGIALSMQGGQGPAALESFSKAVSLSPNNMAALMGEGELYYQAHDKRGIPVLTKILTLNANNTTAREMLANLQSDQQQCQAAVTNFEAGGNSFQAHPESLAAYGYCLAQLKQPGKAIPVFEQLAVMLPASSFIKYDLAVLHLQTKQNQEAIQVLQPLLSKTPPDPDVLSLASEIYEAAGDTPKAVALLREAIVLDPLDASLYNSFAALSINHESFKVGIDVVEAGLKRLPQDSSLHISRGLLYAELGDYDRAEADFTTAEQLDSRQSLSAYALALARIQKDQRGGSNQGQTLLSIREQLHTHPDSALLHFLLAKLLFNQGPAPASKPFEEALQSAQTAVKLQPNLIEARDLLTSMYLRSGDYDAAAKQCRLTLEAVPDDQSATYHLMIALRHIGGAKDSREIASLVKRLSQLEQSTLQEETDRKRFRLVEQAPPPPPSE